jgi:hypothetical protein
MKMAYHRINFSLTQDTGITRLGGLPMIADPAEWPKFPMTGQPLLPLLSITGDFLVPVFPEYSIPAGHTLTLFTVCDPGNYDTIIALQMQDSEDLRHLNSGASLVLLHKTAAAPCPAPAGCPALIPMKKLELEAVPDGDDDIAKGCLSGDMASKVGGIAGWAQDPVDLEGMKYVLQLSEGLFGKGRHAHGRIFGGDCGFLLLNEKLAPGKAGIWIIQTA